MEVSIKDDVKQARQDRADIMSEFLVEYNKLSVHERRTYGFPESWNDDFINSMKKKARAHFVARASNFLTSLRELRERTKDAETIHKPALFMSFYDLQTKEEAKAAEEALQIRLDELHARRITTKNLLNRFSARSPEERTYIFRYVFAEARPPDEATWKFYANWARVEENRDKKKKDYLEHVDRLQKALETFE